MKIIKLLTTAIIILPTLQFTAHAAATCTEVSCTSLQAALGSLEGCTVGQKDKCYTGSIIGTAAHIYSCTQCNPQRRLEAVTTSCENQGITATKCVCINGCNNAAWSAYGMPTGYEYSIQCGDTCDDSPKYRCAANYYGTTTDGTTGCQHKDNCVSDTTYKSFGSTGYERKITRSYDSTNRVCVDRQVLYRCAANYYGSSTNGTSGCTLCPSSKVGGLGDGDPYGSSNPGTTTITGCYIPSGDEICDDTGCFDVTADCYWTN